MHKIILILLVLSLNPPNSNAFEFASPTADNYIGVGLSFMEQSKQVMDQMQSGIERDCDDTIDRTKQEHMEAISEIAGQDITCFCDLDAMTEEKRGLVLKYLGEVKAQTLELRSGNDNLLHGVLRKTPFRQYDGDDRGKTFNIGAEYKIEGEEGFFGMKLDSDGYSAMTKLNNKKKNEKGEHYLYFREYNSISAEHGRYILNEKEKRIYALGEMTYANESDSGNLSKSIQDWYHDFSKRNFNERTIQYHYLKEKEDTHTLSALAGLGYEHFKDIGNWKCQTLVEGRLGASMDVKGNAALEAKVKLQNTISHKNLPWIALSTWMEASTGHLGENIKSGLKLSGNIKLNKVQVSPFVGVEKNFTEMDKKYGDVAGNAHELYHVIGVTFRF